MLCVCEKRCQAKLDWGKTTFFKKGQVQEFEKCPSYFRPLEGDDSTLVDFLTAGEEELTLATWKFDDAFKAIKEKYNVDLKREEGTKKSEVIAQILDARFRSIDIDPNKVI